MRNSDGLLNGKTSAFLTNMQKKLLTIILFTGLAFIGVQENASCAFIPGSGGHITDVSFTSEANMIGCLFVTKSDRYYSDGSPVVDFQFPAPSTYGATSVTLQYSPLGEDNWANYQHNGADTTTVGNNFSISPAADYKYRLLFNGGDNDGFTSNVVEAAISLLDTRFSNWGLDESMWISGVMLPWVGRGLEASFSVQNNDDFSTIENGLTYQWYRVNPATYESVVIAGATSLTYTTTAADVGYHLICRGTGNDTTVGGFIQVMSTSGVLIPNVAYVSNLTSNGFTLNLEKTIDSLLPEALILSYQDPVTFQNIGITVTNVVKIADGIYAVSAAIPPEVSSLYLTNTSYAWRIAEQFGEGEFAHVMEGMTITVTTSNIGDINDDGSIDLTDTILALQELSGTNTGTQFDLLKEVGNDGRIGLAEAIFSMRVAAAIDNDGDGSTVAAGDCNDIASDIYPGATEVCSDGIDQDCNGSDLACSFE